ncbi:hypothetical protein K431DRAFT_280952 [Polychaeton citri CBS 116435]|uniref:N-acetyltransferase domain-containing protein n=1 Tax=Polychaeton citri CBS 116435 TaxID=1314669 RepID=A0A9P4URG0_9PEZI|nr:hypothetical protein K431DRAFT_280952 [Polychaeton citri CBS 116435]
MRINASTSISTPSLLLVPYCPHHVPTYHDWMQDPSIQEATASEPLSLEEEYAMQRSWRTDRDKLTFIVCSPLQPDVDGAGAVVKAGRDDTPERMVGDVNLFLFDYELDEDYDNGNDAGDGGQAAKSTLDGDASTASARAVVGELELMIPSPSKRRKGYGRSTLLAFIYYILDGWAAIAVEYTGSRDGEETATLAYLRVRINESNQGSLRLFGSLGFTQVGSANYFGEVELRWLPGVDALRARKAWQEPKLLRYGGHEEG